MINAYQMKRRLRLGQAAKRTEALEKDARRFRNRVIGQEYREARLPQTLLCRKISSGHVPA